MPVDERVGQATQLPLSVETADTFWSRFCGLMFRKELVQGNCLHIIPCNSIHMLFMRFSIDVIFLSNEREIVKLKRGVRPWAMVWPVRKAHSVLEMPVGSVAKLNLKTGDILDWA